MKYLHQDDIRDLEDKELQLLYLLGGLNSKDKTVCNANCFWGCDIRCSCGPVPNDERLIKVKEFIKKHNISNETFMRLTLTYLKGEFVKYNGEYGELILELDRILMDYNFIHSVSEKVPAEDLKEKELLEFVEKYIEVEDSKLNNFLEKYSLTITDFIVLAKTSINYNYIVLRDFKKSDLPVDLFNILEEFELYQSLEFVREYQKQAKEIKNYDKTGIVNAIYSFKKLPLKHQLAVMKSFVTKVKKEKDLEQRELIEQECKNKGHDYDKWQRKDYSTCERNPYLNSRDYLVPEGMEWISVPHTKWERTCKRCGFIDMVEQEPQELTEERKKQEKKAKIKKLRKELHRLENEE